MKNPVSTFYNNNPENEWNRLFLTPYRRIEYEVIQYFLSRYLPTQGNILDLGGGPGRYTISLCQKGYQCTLVDISEANIKLAKQKIENYGVQSFVDMAVVGDALNLDFLPDKHFDAVLCMGPFYHLIRLEERMQCLKECARIIKPHAPLFITCLPRETYIRDALRAGQFIDLVQHNKQAVEEILEYGYSKSAQVPNSYFCHPSEIDHCFDESGFECILKASCYGFASFMDAQVNEIGKHPEVWQQLIQWIIETCTEPSALAGAEHLFAIGKKSN